MLVMLTHTDTKQEQYWEFEIWKHFAFLSILTFSL